ncbi:MAG: hypothetical protein HN742_16845 [Lentisphaerae bacterium]|jgi:hypothetical protein|nr:hypothetical protein [Lentisphaerota bacterium]MBT4815056.1 hypothetical protein [Lentisphaerota bacterium]MBT5606446.1 hypothetical protein [Lentisphaerota bacterium]MBT7057206.1 hypothetical protein [Lentisphaerota bacterium]MBT7843549.1 hypothetical protein [Lentisphaerota bacterium]
MKMLRGICLAVTAMVLATTASAEEWKLKLGANYRIFGEAELTGFAFSNPDLFTGNGFVSGNLPGLLAVNVVNQGLQVEAGAVSPDGDFAELHRVDFASGADDHMDASRGFVLAASGMFNEVWDVELSLAVNKLDSGASATATGTTERYDTSNDDSWAAAGGTAAQWIDSTFAGWAGPLAPPVGGYQVDATGAVAYDFEVDVYTFGLGLSRDLQLGECVDVSLSAGPTITLGDFSVSRTESAAFTDVANTPIYSNTLHDDGLEVVLGAYASVSVGLVFDEQLTLEAGARYDYGVSQLQTDLADLDLSGLSGELKLVFSY